jgi:hypothetical protein
MLRSSSQSDDFVGRTGSAARVASNALRHGTRTDLADEVDSAEAVAIAKMDPAPLLAALSEAVALLTPSLPSTSDVVAPTGGPIASALQEPKRSGEPLASRERIQDRCAGQSGGRASGIEECFSPSRNARGG